MSRQMWVEVASWVVADGTAVANTTTETILFPDVTIPANLMQDGRVLRVRAFGKLSTTGTPTIIFSLRWGGVSGTVLGVTEALTNGSGVATLNWSVEAYIQTRSNGSSGTLLCFGDATVNTSTSAVVAQTFGISGYDAPAVATVDLTADTSLSLTGKWSAASASNTITGMLQTVEVMN